MQRGPCVLSVPSVSGSKQASAVLTTGNAGAYASKMPTIGSIRTTVNAAAAASATQHDSEPRSRTKDILVVADAGRAWITFGKSRSPNTANSPLRVMLSFEREWLNMIAVRPTSQHSPGYCISRHPMAGDMTITWFRRPSKARSLLHRRSRRRIFMHASRHNDSTTMRLLHRLTSSKSRRRG